MVWQKAQTKVCTRESDKIICCVNFEAAGEAECVWDEELLPPLLGLAPCPPWTSSISRGQRACQLHRWPVLSDSTLEKVWSGYSNLEFSCSGSVIVRDRTGQEHSIAGNVTNLDIDAVKDDVVLVKGTHWPTWPSLILMLWALSYWS